MVEQRGQESLFFAEHTHIPASRETPWPGGAPLPSKYWHCYDLFVALTAAAAATSRLRVGSGICLIIERDPIITANAVASIDHLSGGRMEFGVGAGWNREEMRNHGTDPRTRMALMRERVEAMKAIWTQEEASYHGEHVNFERIWCHPKPAQRPHPPVLVGGNGPTVLDRVLAFADGWLPNHRDDERLYERVADLFARAERPIEVHVLGVPADPRELERAAIAGTRRVLHWLPSGGLSTVEAELERWESAIVEFNGGG
jgi:probable F420-dependent oxidoreductase